MAPSVAAGQYCCRTRSAIIPSPWCAGNAERDWATNGTASVRSSVPRPSLRSLWIADGTCPCDRTTHQYDHSSGCIWRIAPHTLAQGIRVIVERQCVGLSPSASRSGLAATRHSVSLAGTSANISPAAVSCGKSPSSYLKTDGSRYGRGKVEMTVSSCLAASVSNSDS
jgi:hypothetical protein